MATYQPIAADATDLPINEIILNVEWAGLVIESLTELQSARFWNGTDEEIEHCISQIETVKDLLMGYDLTPPHIGFTAIKPIGQTQTPNALTVQTFTNVVNNDGSAWNSSTSRFTAPIGGRYDFFTGITSTGLNGLQITKNGTVVVSVVPSANYGTISISLVLAAGDYVQVVASTSGTFTGGVIPNTFFSGHLVYGASDE
jgi:hypothetical protein